MTGQNSIRGVVLMVLSNIAFCVMAALVRYIAYVDSFKTTLFRFAIGLGVIGIAAMSGKIRLAFVDVPALFTRGILGGIAVLLAFVSITRLGIVKGSIISYTYPIFATMFGILLLKERVSLVKWVGIGASFIGILLLMYGSGSDLHNLRCVGLFELMAITGAMLGGLTIVLVKKLHATESTPAIFFAQCLMGFWIVLLPAAAMPMQIGLNGALVLVGIGIMAAAGQLLSTEGIRHVSVSTSSLLIMLTPVLNVGVGMVCFHETLCGWSWLGVAVVIASTGLVAWGKVR